MNMTYGEVFACVRNLLIAPLPAEPKVFGDRLVELVYLLSPSSAASPVRAPESEKRRYIAALKVQLPLNADLAHRIYSARAPSIVPESLVVAADTLQQGLDRALSVFVTQCQALSLEAVEREFKNRDERRQA